jgi:hypothetical protein
MCLALLVASPRLLDIASRTPEQMALVTALCWASAWSEELSRAYR